MKFDFTERRAAIEVERNEALAKLPEARMAYERAVRGHEDAQAAWNAFCARVNRSLRRSEASLNFSSHCSEASIQLVDVTPVVSTLIDEKRQEYRRAGAALSKAKANLADLKWIIECRNLDLEQLDLLERPPTAPLEPAPPRSKPVADVDDDFDVIQFPATRVA
jgi:hypothetical protein